jgi:hypothetical protein
VARRAATLAQRPDVEGLVALRSVVAARQAGQGADARQLESVLRLLDQSLAQARKRQLAIDRRQLTSTTTKNQ